MNKCISESWILSFKKQMLLAWGICQNEDLRSAVVVGLLQNSFSLGMTEFLADGPDWHLWSWTGVWRSLSGSAKTFPDIPCVSHMLGGPTLRLGTPKERLSVPSGIRWGGKDTGWLATWECPLLIILKIFWISYNFQDSVLHGRDQLWPITSL